MIADFVLATLLNPVSEPEPEASNRQPTTAPTASQQPKATPQRPRPVTPPPELTPGLSPHQQQQEQEREDNDDNAHQSFPRPSPNPQTPRRVQTINVNAEE